ncbi:MAG: hypothetical protein R3E98_05385 [Gemmatimonadota bacterium]
MSAPGRSARGAAGWAALLVLGHVSALQLVIQGTPQRFPHYRTWESLIAAPSWVPTLILAVQAAVVGIGLLQRRSALGAALQPLATPRGAVLIAALVALSATVARDPVGWVQEMVFSSFLQAVAFGNVIVLALTLPLGTGAGLATLLDRDAGGAPRWRRVALGAAAAFAFGASALLALLAYQRHPHVPDELAYLLQARMFAAGRLWMPPPPVPEGFVVDLMIFEPDRWYSTFAPGWPVALAVGTLLGAAWLVNPLLSGLNVLLVDRALRPWVGERAALLAALLYAVSPWTLFLGMSFMSHPFTLACALGAALAVERLRTGRLGWALPAGVAIGLVGLTRPLDGLALAVPLGLRALVRDGRLQPVRAGLLAAATAVVGGLTLPYNRALTGDTGTFPVMRFWDEAAWPGVNALGFGPDRGLGPNGLDPFAGHGPLDVVLNANLNLTQLNVDLFGWGVASLLPLLWLLIFGRLRRGDGVLLGFLVWVAGVQSLYYFSGGADFGARYWYLGAAPLYALSARGLQELARAVAPAAHRVSTPVAVLAVIALIGFVPWRALDRYRGYRGMEAGVRTLAVQRDFGRSLVLVQGRRHPDYASAVVYNPLDLQADAPIYAWARSDDTVARLLWEYRDRPVWVLDGPTRTGAGFEVVAGPTPARTLLAERGIQTRPDPGGPLDARAVRQTVPTAAPLGRGGR